MSSLADLRLPRYLGLALLYIVVTTGCAGIPQPLAGTPLGSLLEGTPPAPGPNDKKITIELHPEYGRPEKVELALAEDDCVDSALHRGRVTSRFGRMKINVFRPSGKPGAPVYPLKVDYDAAAGHVPPQYDYALRDGDRIVVKEDPTTGFDRMMDTLLGPFRGE